MKEILKVFKALSDATRLRIVLLLAERDLCVCELVYILKMEQSRISHQLRILRDADLVEDVRDGRWMIYRVPENRRGVLDAIFKGELRSRLGSPPEISADAQRLEACIKDNIRAKLCPSGGADARR
jgi:ArsR family transcriptional regulator, arsenate/arsenite/antimonite-responsive transcriptional repressor